MKNDENNHSVMVEVLKGAVAVDMTPKLSKKLEWVRYAKDVSNSGRNKEAKAFAEDAETQARMLFKQLAALANEAYPTEKEISESSLGLLEDVMKRYKFTLIISKN